MYLIDYWDALLCAFSYNDNSDIEILGNFFEEINSDSKEDYCKKISTKYQYYRERHNGIQTVGVLTTRQQIMFEKELGIEAISKETGIAYDDHQAEAIRTAVHNMVIVFTGA